MASQIEWHFSRNLLRLALWFIVIRQEESVVLLMLLALTDRPLCMLGLTRKKHKVHELLLNFL